jgi:hypothetical protein
VFDFFFKLECNVQRSALPLVKPHNFMHPDDHLVLEDESGRVKLGGTVLSPSLYVTGISHAREIINSCEIECSLLADIRAAQLLNLFLATNC